MNEIQKALIKLEQTAGEVTSTIIKDLIEEHNNEKERTEKLYKEYKGEVPIMERKKKAIDEICNKTANDFRGYIVDTMTGYFLGNPITYSIEKMKEGQGVEKLRYFLIMNDAFNQDKLIGKKAGICGSCPRLLYIDKDGNERMMNLDPWEVIFVNDGSIDQMQYALRYYKVEVQVGGEWKSRNRVEWYDMENISFWIENNEGNYFPDTTESQNPRPHLFGGVPVIEFQNNEEKQGDFEKVISLIDAYDADVSYDQDEHEAFRQSYLILTGVSLGSDENVKKINETRSIEFPETGATAKFLTKDVNDTYIENHKRRLEQNIHKFSRIPDMSDEKFSGDAQTGEARKWKLLGMETKAGDKELMFVQALRQQFKLLTQAWAKKNVTVNYLDITFEFTRKLPVELSHEAETTGKLKGNVSERTRLGLLSFVDDPEAEIKQMEKETPSVNLDLITEGINEI